MTAMRAEEREQHWLPFFRLFACPTLTIFLKISD
jgi:hypothetical protein